MTSRTLAAGLLVAGCLTAAAAGSYVAVRQNAVEAQPAVLSAPPSEAPAAAPAEAPAAPPVNETEGVLTPPEQPNAETSSPPVEIERKKPAAPPAQPRAFPRETRVPRAATMRAKTTPEPVEPTPLPPSEPALPPPPPASLPATAASNESPTAVERAVDPLPVERRAEPTFDQIVLPSSSVIGLELETTVTTERAQVEDRVDARVTRDVYADGRLVIPSGSRVIGNVTLVERGGKVKERARLGIRFHTLVVAGGRQVALRTEPIYREGEPPANDSSRKIGGAAIGGAVLGAILGGGKGAIAGATAGAAGGTAAVMAGGRKAATLSAGSVVTVKLTAPVTLEIER